MCGYLKYYYPTEFCTSFLNCAKNDEDITNGTQLALSKGCNIEKPLFRYSTSEYGCDSDNKTIYKGIGSIKDMGKNVGDNLYTLKDNNYDDFVDLLYNISEEKLAKKGEIDKLIKIDYFKEFGDINLLLKIHDIFLNLKKRTTFKLIECENYNLNPQDISDISEKTTAKQFSGVNTKELIKLICNNINYEPTTTVEHMSYDLGILGYTNYSDKTIDDNIYIVSAIEKNKYDTRFITLYQPKTKEYSQYKVNRKNFTEHPCKIGDILRCVIREQNRRIKVDDKWVESEEKEVVLKDYVIIKEFE